MNVQKDCFYRHAFVINYVSWVFIDLGVEYCELISISDVWEWRGWHLYLLI